MSSWDKIASPEELIKHVKAHSKLNEDVICNRQLTELNSFVLVTSINVPQKHKFNSFIFGGCKVVFYKNCPRKYLKYRLAKIEDINTLNELNLSHNEKNLTVLVYVKSPDYMSACKQSLIVLDAFRAMVNLGLKKNIRIDTAIDSVRYSTFSKVKLGQVHTVHLPSGHIAGGLIWFEPDFNSNNGITLADLNKTLVNFKLLKNKISNHPFSSHLVKGLCLYINALDTVKRVSRDSGNFSYNDD